MSICWIVSCRAAIASLSNDSCCPSKVRQQATMCQHVLAYLMNARTGVSSVSKRLHDEASKPHDSTSSQSHELGHRCLLKVDCHNSTWKLMCDCMHLCIKRQVFTMHCICKYTGYHISEHCEHYRGLFVNPKSPEENENSHQWFALLSCHNLSVQICSGSKKEVKKDSAQSCEKLTTALLLP